MQNTAIKMQVGTAHGWSQHLEGIAAYKSKYLLQTASHCLKTWTPKFKLSTIKRLQLSFRASSYLI